jgi:Cu-processing system ATP-binding protein
MVTFDAFSKRYGAVDAVASLTFQVAPGSIVALLGPNGSGKTTSIKAAAGLIRPTSGRVLLGNPGRSSIDPDTRALCSFLPQRVAFPDRLTGREVIEFYRSLRDMAPARAAEVMRLTGLNGSSGRAVGTYSGGMRQRLALGVAMLPQAPVLLLDEPTAALDPDGLRMFYEAIETRRDERQTVLFSSHQLGDVERLADRFVVLVHGRIAASLTAAELSARLADRGEMTLTLDALPDGLLDRVRAIVPGARCDGAQLVVPAPTAVRLQILDLVRASRAEIRAMAAHDGRLDAFYRELVGDRS